ncbi:MAG: Ppx/GppA family phosphatase [Coriobacteriaceae bacterium]|nr:Ppx/GppA family phosphatase [Coriobacteriaceae bacterium]
MKRLAAIDIGTNSVRLVVAQPERGGGYRLIDDEKSQVRLGEGLGATGALSEAAMDRTVEALGRMLEIARGLEADRVRAVATAAVRIASNGEAFVARLRDELGVRVEVISAFEEGRLAFLGAAANFDLAGRMAVVDIGGGSVEIVRSTGTQIEDITSLPLGVVALAELLPTDEDPPSRASLKRLRRHIRASLRGAFGARPHAIAGAIGSGGTVTTLGSIVAAWTGDETGSVQGMELTQADVVHIFAWLRGLTLEQRRHVPGLPEYRADIIVPGALLVREVLRHLGTNTLLVNGKGLREGLVLDTIRQETGAANRPPDTRKAVLAFAKRCRFDQAHSLHVAALALSLFDQMADPSLDERHRRMLETAAILHDVGYFIGYDKHHRHSGHLITHADLPGLSPRDIALVAAVARYHRGALPKLRHDEYARLVPEDRDAAARLGGILRLADGLDRGRAQRVIAVGLEQHDGTVTLIPEGEGDLRVEVYGAREKADLFESAFGVTLRIGAP